MLYESFKDWLDSKLITSQGIDDILAMLLALSASPEDVEIILISLTFGNIDVERYAN